MERSVRNVKRMLRENVTRFLEHADGREVTITVTARLVKKHLSSLVILGLGSLVSLMAWYFLVLIH
ncbi:hypothetical protein LOAG_02170 [Loa loa]|uniref:Uncharacterized protein n=1 Tax=Loa loa TaxID=7209 RepID=A0A1S0U725_LOALO|nr:hypothetical protein LOAG_02170 [Loa loa]EFO26315.1 hypothetical protein LOAG_02170 [Loa loa]